MKPIYIYVFSFLLIAYLTGVFITIETAAQVVCVNVVTTISPNTVIVTQSCSTSTVPAIPEYPLGLPLLAIFIAVAYGLIRRRTKPQNKIQ